ncbi:MAG: protein-export chaperone SecB [Bacillota bacterium]
MFPYIREHISTVTQKAGVKPVLLAPINVLAIRRRICKIRKKSFEMWCMVTY